MADELARRDKLIAALFNAPTDAIGLIGLDGTILYANEKQCRQLNKPREALIGTSIWNVYPSDKVNHRKIILKQVIENGQPITFIDRYQTHWFEITFYPIAGENGTEQIALYGRDITKQIVAEEKLKRMTLQLITIQEDERRRISQDLHDDIGQSLTALILSLKAIDGKLVSNQGEAGDQVKSAIRNVEALMRQVRQVFYQLRPPSLDTLPLPKALESFCAAFEPYTSLQVDFSCPSDLPVIPNVQALALYRLVQEGLNNAAKHARATSVWINLDCDNSEVTLSIEDNGQGFDPSKSGGGMGLTGIRDRFLMLNGTFDIESVPGKGTRLFGTLPLTMSIM